VHSNRAVTLLASAFTLVLVLTGCSPTAAHQSAQAEPRPAAASRPLVFAIRVEPESIATRRIGQPGSGLTAPKRMFNGTIATIDETGTPHPYVVERLPMLHTDSWQVFPDGRMETTYRLRPGLQWHDGTPATPEDFRFTWRVYTRPEYGFGTPPFHAMEEVAALDPQTFVIRWKAPYADAGNLSTTNDEFPILPAHILGEPFDQLDADAFVNRSFWTRDFVGLGPYRLTRWEAGSYLEGQAFDAHILGRPKIERIKIMFIGDGNTVLANILAGEVHVAMDNAIGLPQLDVLRRESREHALLPAGASWRLTYAQLRPEYASPRAILDHRVRKALAHAWDRQALNEGVYLGMYMLADTMIMPGSRFGRAMEAGAIKYPYDRRRSEQLMTEAGFLRGMDGFYTSPAEGRLSIDAKASAGPADTEAISVMAASWRQEGFDVAESLLPTAQAQVAEISATFPGLLTRTTFEGLTTLVAFNTGGIPRPENRWIGPNRGGWSNPEYDRLADVFKTTLDDQFRGELVTQMMRLFTEDLPVLPGFFLNRPIPHPITLRGLKDVPGETNFAFNIHEWEFR
jgi:peptide/nickel transport system substrate-binding protein